MPEYHETNTREIIHLGMFMKLLSEVFAQTCEVGDLSILSLNLFAVYEAEYRTQNESTVSATIFIQVLYLNWSR